MKTTQIVVLAALLAGGAHALLVGEVKISRFGAAVEIRCSDFDMLANGEVRKSDTERVDYLRMEDITAISFDPSYNFARVTTGAVYVQTRGQQGDARHVFIFRPGKGEEGRKMAEELALTVFRHPEEPAEKLTNPTPNKAASPDREPASAAPGR